MICGELLLSTSSLPSRCMCLFSSILGALLPSFVLYRWVYWGMDKTNDGCFAVAGLWWYSLARGSSKGWSLRVLVSDHGCMVIALVWRRDMTRRNSLHISSGRLIGEGEQIWCRRKEGCPRKKKVSKYYVFITDMTNTYYRYANASAVSTDRCTV